MVVLNAEEKNIAPKIPEQIIVTVIFRSKINEIRLYLWLCQFNFMFQHIRTITEKNQNCNKSNKETEQNKIRWNGFAHTQKTRMKLFYSLFLHEHTH